MVELVEREAVTMIAEENRALATTLGRQVAESLRLPWLQIDMTLLKIESEPESTGNLRTECKLAATATLKWRSAMPRGKMG